MNTSFRAALSAGLVVALAGLVAILPVDAAPTRTTRTAEPSLARAASAPTDRFIVRFRDDAPEHRNPVARQHLLDALSHKLGVKVSHGRGLANGADLLRTARKLGRAEAKRLVIALRSDPRVQYVEVDRLHTPQSTPNDPLYAEQVQLIKAQGGHGVDIAWNRSTGAGVVVAVVDTGLTAHPDLDGNVLPGYDFITDATTANDGDGRDANPSDPGDWSVAGECGLSYAVKSSWHGTAVAGVLAAVADNNIGLAGVAHDAKILPVRALGKCGGYTSDIADGIVWAAGGTVAGVPDNANPAEVINLSLATSGACDATMQAAIDAANAAGAVVVASAGNGNVNVATLSPASCDGVIVVRRGDHWRAGYNSGFGTRVDLLASGGDAVFVDLGEPPYVASMPTTYNNGMTVPTEPMYDSRSGTSLAAAITSGTVALMQSASPQSPATVEALLKVTGEPQRELCLDACDPNSQATRLLDADAATLVATTPTLVANEHPQVTETDAQSTVSITVSLTRAMAAPVTFTAATVDGTAVAGADYVALAPTVFTLAPGETSKTLHVTLLGDDVGEMVEAFDVVFSDVAGATDLTRPVPVRVKDDDALWIDPWHWRQVIGVAGGGDQLFAFEPPAEARNVRVRTESLGWAVDPDLYVRQGQAPTTSAYDCASTAPDQIENCALGDVSGVHFAMLHNLTEGEAVYLIVEWDAKPTLSIRDAKVEEGDGGYTPQLSFVVVRPDSEAAFTTDFDVVISGGTATAGSDFVAGGGTYHFKEGESYKEIRVDVIGDTALEPNETVIAQVANVVWGQIGDGTATGTIANDDGAVLEVVDVTAPEGQAGDNAATVTVALTEPAAAPVSFDFATADDTAAAGVDYVAASGSRTIPAGQLSATFPVTLKGDTANEGDEALFVDISNASVSILRERGTVEIANDDGGLAVADVTLAEGNSGLKSATIVVQMANAAPVPVSFEVRAVSGTATAGVDFLGAWQAMTIPAGMTSKAFTVAVKGDTANEGDETFIVQLSNAANTNIADGTAIGTITNDDLPSISVADVTVNEGDGGTKLMTFSATLSAATDTPVTFNVKSTDNTASAGSDYVALDATGLSIPAGQLAKTFTVTIKGDTTVEPTEYFRVDLANVVGATVADGRGVGYIVNNDGARLVVNNVAVAEGNAGQKALTFTVSLTQAAPGPVTYGISTSNGTAAAGSDYVALNLTGQVIPAGELSKTHTVLVNGDTAIEDTEAFAINVRQPTGASVWDGQGIGYVLNDDSPALFVPDAGVVEGNAGTKVINVTVKLTEPALVPVSYTLTTSNGSATAGSDYAALGLADQVIPAGQLQKVHQIVVNGDTDIEANESLNITLTNPVGATMLDAKAVGFIYNDDGPTLTVGDATISEGNAGTRLLTFTVTLSVAQGSPVTYNIATSNLTATAGSDYVASSLVGESIPAGQLSKAFAVTLNGDTTAEANETFRVTLSNPTAGVSLLRPVATGTINNDD